MNTTHSPLQTMTASDQEIGAIEIKDGQSNSRAGVLANGSLQVFNATYGANGHLFSGSVTIASPGTPLPLSTSTHYVCRVDLQANVANIGRICVGDATINAVTRRVAELNAGEAYSIECPPGVRLDLAEIYIDGNIATDGVNYNAYVIEVLQ